MENSESNKQAASFDCVFSDNGKGDLLLKVTGSINTYNSGSLISEVKRYLKTNSPSSITIDLENISYFDDYGVLALSEIRDMFRSNGAFRINHTGERVSNILNIMDFESIGKTSGKKNKTSSNFFINLGTDIINSFSDLKYMASFLGAVCLAMLYVCLHPRSLRFGDVIHYMKRAGVDALPIVGLISFLLGLIIAFMSSIQLKQLGADILVAPLVALAMTYELSPIMTCILVSGRSGSAFASEIGTMKVSEEIDALFTMGFEPTRFLVLPKMLAAFIVVPILTLFSDIFAITGGLVVGVSVMDLTTNAYINQTLNSLTLFYIFWGVLKSAVFSIVISWVGCLKGFQVKGGADSVGKATTSAVVLSIFLIIIIDAIFAMIHIYWF